MLQLLNIFNCFNGILTKSLCQHFLVTQNPALLLRERGLLLCSKTLPVFLIGLHLSLYLI
nr:MAG TPA: hypothetical protein [Caudoviricetes sp.]